jgi:hypothetical protein
VSLAHLLIDSETVAKGLCFMFSCSGGLPKKRMLQAGFGSYRAVAQINFIVVARFIGLPDKSGNYRFAS